MSNGWDHVTFTFKPDAPYEYLIIESKEPTYTDTDISATLAAGVSLNDIITGKFTNIKTQSYIYVDDVSVVEECFGQPLQQRRGGFDNETEIADEPMAKVAKSDFFKVYPNPNNGQFSVKYGVTEVLENEKAVIKVYNLMGQLVKEVNASAISEGMNSIDLDLNDSSLLSEGVYIVNFSYGATRHISRVTLVR